MIIQVKVQAAEWLGRTVYRAYYKAGRSWKRYGKYEAASPEQLRAIIDRLEKSASLEWV